MPRSTTALPPRLLTVAEAATYLGTTTSWLYELVARHDIPCVRIGRAVRITGDALSRTPVRPRVETQTCTLVRPVHASTRNAERRHGMSQREQQTARVNVDDATWQAFRIRAIRANRSVADELDLLTELPYRDQPPPWP